MNLVTSVTLLTKKQQGLLLGSGIIRFSLLLLCLVFRLIRV